jgi:uncharacterized membrane protein
LLTIWTPVTVFPGFHNEEMTMSNLTAYGCALVTFLIADMAWLGTMSSRFYKPIMGDMLLERFNLGPAAVFYLLYPLGLVIFAVSPALRSGNLTTAIQLGALFGLFTYGTYDLTNQATLRNWTTSLTLVDMAWGGILGALTAAVSYLVTNRLAG